MQLQLSTSNELLNTAGATSIVCEAAASTAVLFWGVRYILEFRFLYLDVISGRHSSKHERLAVVTAGLIPASTVQSARSCKTGTAAHDWYLVIRDRRGLMPEDPFT